MQRMPDFWVGLPSTVALFRQHNHHAYASDARAAGLKVWRVGEA